MKAGSKQAHWYTSLISTVSECKLVPGWGLQKQISMLLLLQLPLLLLLVFYFNDNYGIMVTVTNLLPASSAVTDCPSTIVNDPTPTDTDIYTHTGTQRHRDTDRNRQTDRQREIQTQRLTHCNSSSGNFNSIRAASEQKLIDFITFSSNSSLLSPVRIRPRSTSQGEVCCAGHERYL